MTFLERYQREDTWYGKVIVMEIYHLARIHSDKNWTIADTARDFGGVSNGLVSENLKLAKAMHERDDLINAKSRVDALKKLEMPYRAKNLATPR